MVLGVHRRLSKKVIVAAKIKIMRCLVYGVVATNYVV